MNQLSLIEKADILNEALPYIQKFRGSTLLIKFGGSSMEDPELVRNTMRDIVLLECIGFRPIVVHGGGKAISAELKRQDIPVGCDPAAGGAGLRKGKRLRAAGIGG